MKFLKQIRSWNNNLTSFEKIMNTGMILIFGISLGIFSKWLDNTSFSDEIWWQRVLNSFDLRNLLSMLSIWLVIALSISIFSTTPFRASINVFMFFLGINISYHLYTIIFAGFNPTGYMMIWYSITLISPILGFICWYSKGNGVAPVIIDICIVAVMILCSFNIGMWYFDFTSIGNTIIFIITLIVLYHTPKKSVIVITFGLIIAFIVRIFV